MKNITIATIIFMLMSMVCFIACDDKHETSTCDPANCEMAANATEMMCNDAGACVVKACAEGFNASEDAKTCEPACTCDPACAETEDCLKGEDGVCACFPKVVEKCDSKCEEGKECKCAFNEEGVEVCGCEEKPAAEPSEECKDKAANDACGENKVCDEGLHCVDVAPANEPECNLICKEGMTCKCVDNDGKADCKCVVSVPDECKCDNGDPCPEGGKDACVTEEKPAEEAKCEPACEGENMECKCEADKCECVEKNAEESECNEEKPCADENKECKENKCVDKAPEEKPE